MKTTSTSILKKVFVLFFVFAGLHFAKDFLMPMSVSAVIATLFIPFCNWMESKKIYRGMAALISLLVLLLFVFGIGALLGWQISELTNDFSLLKLKAIETYIAIKDYILVHFGITFERQTQLLKAQQSTVTGFIAIMAGSLISIIANFTLILVYIFGLLYYRNHIKMFLLKFSPSSQLHEMENIIYSVARVSQQYLFGLSKMILCLWIMYGIGFSIIGIKNALFFAIICGLLEIIPFIGNLTGSILTLFVAAVHGAGFPVIVGIILIYGLVQLIQGWILEPLIVGSQVKINPLFTIIALVIGELVWGLTGIFLAIPIVAMFKIVCDHIDSLKPYGFLIGEIVTVREKSAFSKKLISFLKR